jgi:hypothetical protein
MALSPDSVADAVWDDASALRLLGLMQENYYMDQCVYTDYQGQPLLTSARLRTYSAPASVGTDNDVLATYLVTATWTAGEMDTYKVVKQ